MSGKKKISKQSYNPYGKFTGVLIPHWLKIRKELSWGAKFAFAELTNFAGANGECFASREKLADKLGVSVRSAQNYLNELYKNNLVIQEIRSGATNKYQFLNHPWITWKKKDEVFFVDLEGPGGDVQNPAHTPPSYPQPVQNPAQGECRILHGGCAGFCTHNI